MGFYKPDVEFQLSEDSCSKLRTFHPGNGSVNNEIIAQDVSATRCYEKRLLTSDEVTLKTNLDSMCILISLQYKCVFIGL